MTNGIFEITVKGEKYKLRFGMQAFLVFQERSAKSTASVDTLEGGLKAICDLFFAGMVGNSIRNELPIKSYSECCDIFDDLTIEPGFNDQVAGLWATFNESIKSLSANTEPVKKVSKKKASQ